MPSSADVYRELSGREVIRGRAPAVYRGGDGPSLCFKDEAWYDHVTGKGGGPLQMAHNFLGEAEGRRWFEERYGRIRCRQKAARRAPLVPDNLLRTVVAGIADVHKQLALRNDDEARLALWSPIDRVARAGGAEWRRFHELVETSNPELYRHWLGCAVELEADSRRATAIIVGMLAGVSA